ncbi:regulatory protein GemA [uncultured Methylobacterium sp.]|uniref:regulatory protein GemA n=1 Tax=uncultured Methylobacterium sp. TaxID=157278 RepID=UPI0035CC39E2
MIRPAQLKLLDRARAAVAPDAAEFAEMLQRWGDAQSVDALSAAGFERFMDYCTVCGFRDRQRPVLSKVTIKAFDLAWYEAGFTRNQMITHFHSGGFRELKDVDGQKLLYLMANLERSTFRIERFEYFRTPKITSAQLRLLQTARRKIGQPDDRYYPMLQIFGAANTAASLDQRGFDLMMAALRRDGFEDRARAPSGPTFGARPGFASPEQVDLIRTLWREWIGPTAESEAAVEAGLNAWLERYHRASSLRFVTTSAAGKVITALRAMKARKREPRLA